MLQASVRWSISSTATARIDARHSATFVCSALITVVLAMLRAGLPTVPELVALICATLVVCAQVVSASMRWSVQRPFAVDMRSARATPAPPVVMVGYSTRLALGTTMVGLTRSW